MAEKAGEARLKGFEVVKDICLIDEDFSVDNGLLTPTFKLKRHECQKKFGHELTAMYAKLNSVASGSKDSNLHSKL